MKQFKVLCMATLALLAVACNPIKTVATVDVTVVDQNDKPVEGIMVARFNSGSSLYIQNADEKHATNAAGLARFELKLLEDLAPQDFGEGGEYFTFRAFDEYNEPITEEGKVFVEQGDKKTLTLKILPKNEGGDEW